MAKRKTYLHLGPPESLGDYGRLFVAGYSSSAPGEQLRLRRTGPFVPPIAIVGTGRVVVTSSARQSLDGAKGVIEFRPVTVEHATRRRWPDSFNPSTAYWRQFGEPEDVIDDGKHDPKLLEEMSPLYEVLLEEDGMIDEDYDREGNLVVKFEKRPKQDLELFVAVTAGGCAIPVADERFVQLLDAKLLEWIELTKIR